MARAANRLSYAGHLVLSACWLGAVVAYLALAVVGITAHDSEVIRAAYRAMELIGTWVIVPSSVATVVTGMVKSSDTRWGFMRRWWVVAELGLSITGVGVLLRHMTAVRMLADAVQAPAFTAEALVLPRVQLLVHAIGGPCLVLAATVLSVCKPFGPTSIGRRVGSSDVILSRVVTARAMPTSHRPAMALGWQRVVGFHAVALLVAVVAAHVVILARSSVLRH